MLNKEFHFFRNNRKKLLAKYCSKHIVIKGKKIIGQYDDHINAYRETVKKEELGTFLIVHCYPGRVYP